MRAAPGRSADAARAYERALSLDPSGSLAEDALARAIEAYAHGGDSERAGVLATRYLSRYPTGRWSARVREVTAVP